MTLQRTDPRALPLASSLLAGERSSEPPLFINRELSWLAFNERVLDEARDPSVPLYERLRFLFIVAANLDELFMVRVAGLQQQIRQGVIELPADGMSASEQLRAISERVHALVAGLDASWRDELAPALARAGIALVRPLELSEAQRRFVSDWFRAQVFPALTPLAVAPGHPFPHLRNKSLNVAVLLGREEARLAVVQLPAMLDRLIEVPVEDGARTFVLLGDVIDAHVTELFRGQPVLETALFRVTRDSDLLVDEEETEDLLSSVLAELRRRELGAAVRLELASGTSPALEARLREAIGVGTGDVYRMAMPLQIADLLPLTERDPRPELHAEPFEPSLPDAAQDCDSLFELVAARDLVLHHPYQSYDPVVRFVAEAAEDPAVMAIKMTLYRTSGDSPFVRALSRASENGKQVTAVVEIKARFDEANNIAWARRLEENGVHVVYGVIGLKTHCSLALVVRREEEAIRRYLHVGTGNYDPHTARQYTDVSLFTARSDVTEDASALFNMLTGYSEPPAWRKVAVAPLDLQTRLIGLISREAERARRGEPARILAKLNSLADPVLIRALYAASQAGVAIDLVVRGICCLKPGLSGISERIRVSSVVDRFLEHTRLIAFGVDHTLEVYVSSADWMPRNFLRRVEVLVPVEDPALRARLVDEVIGTALRDRVKARRLLPDGSYVRLDDDAPAVRSQQVLLEGAR